jgi:tRNA-guanine family transglycosylase
MSKKALNIDSRVSTQEHEASSEEMKKIITLADGKVAACVDLAGNHDEGLKLPLQSGCECYTCRNHTRGYIQHLIAYDEVNWSILLMM